MYFILDNHYTIIIPIFNEVSSIPKLLPALLPYYNEQHEIIIIDDGSTDGSNKILKNCNFINLIRFEQNKGKGIALREGISRARTNKIILFDADLELHPNDIKKLMILDIENNITCVFANRFSTNVSITIWDIGNFFLSKLFNWANNSNVKDALCCAKSFFKSDIEVSTLKSSKFDIDVEISSILVEKTKNIINIDIPYQRRNKNQGKKLSISDSIHIIKRIFNSF